MKDTDYIIRKGRKRITIWHLFPIIIHLFSIIGLSFALILITETILIKYFIIIISFFILIFVCFLHFKALLNRISFYRFINNSSIGLESIIAEFSIEFSLKLYKQDVDIYKMTYDLPFICSFFKIKKEITLITTSSNDLLLNICNSNESVFYAFKDTKEKQIKKIIEVKTQNKTIFENYSIFEPYSHLSKN